MPPLAVIIPAGGSSTRFGSDKLISELGGCTVLARTLKAFAHLDFVTQIVVPTPPGQGSMTVFRSAGLPLMKTCDSGVNRAESVRRGLLEIEKSIEWVAIHDAARPLVSKQLIERVFEAACKHGCAAPALPVSLTVKQATGPLPARVQKTLPRHQLFAMQTPQIMRRDALLEAYLRCPIDLNEVTDDVQLLELNGQEVWLVEGDEQNLKITTPLDLTVARAILDSR